MSFLLICRWAETRYNFDLKTENALQNYLSLLPSVPGGVSGVGKYFTLDKSPSYVYSDNAAEGAAQLVPSAKIITMVRNPTRRAYSSFAMYARLSVTNGKFESMLVKHIPSGEVRFIRNGGNGGECVPGKLLVGSMNLYKYKTCTNSPTIYYLISIGRYCIFLCQKRRFPK